MRGLVFLAVFACIACGAQSSGQSQPAGRFFGDNLTMEFTDDGRLIANAGCNTAAGPVDLAGGTISAQDLGMTEMGCEPQLQQRDQWLMDLLNSKPAWKLDGDKLTVRDLVLTKEKPLPLVGTTWQVDTIEVDGSAGSTPDGANLTFDNQRVRINTGCNTGATSYTVSGTKIRFGALDLSALECPPELKQLEDAVIKACTGEVEFEIEGKTLRLPGIRARG